MEDCKNVEKVIERESGEEGIFEMYKECSVNNPAHYKLKTLRTIDVIKEILTEEEYKGYLLGNVLKYISRYKKKKNPKQDLQKGSWYLNKLEKEVTENELFKTTKRI